MTPIPDLAALKALYPDAPSPRSLDKVTPRLTPLYRTWIEASRFCILSTVGPGGTDASPRGDDGPVVRLLSDTRLAMPDWRGNNRLDSLRNIVEDGRVSLMFLVPGESNVVRLNGRAFLTADPDLAQGFAKAGKAPRSVIVVDLSECYFQCAKAVMRSKIWTAPHTGGLPSAGDFLREADPRFDGTSYDQGYAEYATPRMW